MFQRPSAGSTGSDSKSPQALRWRLLSLYCSRRTIGKPADCWRGAH